MSASGAAVPATNRPMGKTQQKRSKGDTNPLGLVGSKDPFAKLPTVTGSVGIFRRNRDQRNGPSRYSDEMCIQGGKKSK